MSCRLSAAALLVSAIAAMPLQVDGGCYEVYALDEKKERVEAYFHPVTLERVPIAEQ